MKLAHTYLLFTTSFLTILLTPTWKSSRPSGGITIDYNLAINIDQNAQHITATISNIQSPTLDLVISPMEGFDMRSRSNITWYYVDDISVFDNNGNSLQVAHKGQIERHYALFRNPIHYSYFQINTQGKSTIYLEYNLNRGDIYAGFLETILIRPLDHNQLASTTLSFDLPPLWTAAVVSNQTLDKNFSLGKLDTMYGDNPDRVKDYVPVYYAIAPEDEFLVIESDCGVQIFTDYPHPIGQFMYEPNLQSKAIGAIYDYLCQEIGLLSPYNTRFGLVSWPEWITSEIQPGLYSDYWQHNRTGDLSSNVPDIDFFGWSVSTEEVGNHIIDVSPQSYDGYSHKLNRSWFNSGLFQLSSSEPPWITRGGLPGYYWESDMAVVYGSHKVYERWKAMFDYYKINLVDTAKDRPLDDPGEDQDISRFIVNYKSELWVFMLNQRIIEATGGQKDVGDVTRYLYSKFSGSGEAYTIRDLRDAVIQISGSDMQDMFGIYLYSKVPLPLEGYFADSDKDGLMTGLENELGYNPLALDSNMDGLDDANDYLEHCLRAVVNPKYCYDAVPVSLKTPTIPPTPYVTSPYTSLTSVPLPQVRPTIVEILQTQQSDEENGSKLFNPTIILVGLGFALVIIFVLGIARLRRE